MRKFEIMKEEEFPDGLLCVDCGTEIRPGGYYMGRPEAVMEDGSLMEELVCVTCTMT